MWLVLTNAICLIHIERGGIINNRYTKERRVRKNILSEKAEQCDQHKSNFKQDMNDKTPF